MDNHISDLIVHYIRHKLIVEPGSTCVSAVAFIPTHITKCRVCDEFLKLNYILPLTYDEPIKPLDPLPKPLDPPPKATVDDGEIFHGLFYQESGDMILNYCI